MSSTTSADDHPLGEEMTTTPYDQPRRRHLAPWLPFIRHYIEMVLAMAIGMIASMPLGTLAFQAAGAPGTPDPARQRASSTALDAADRRAAVL